MRNMHGVKLYDIEADYLQFAKKVNAKAKELKKTPEVILAGIKDKKFPEIEYVKSDLILIGCSDDDIQKLENLLKLVKAIGDESYKLVKDSITNSQFEEAEIDFEEKEFQASKSTWRSITSTSGWACWCIKIAEAIIYIDFCEKKDHVLVYVIKADLEKSVQEVEHNLAQIGADCEKVIASINDIDFNEIEKTVILEKTVFSNLFK